MANSLTEGAALPNPGLSPLILACLAATWLIWGSTYLAIKWALISLPPFFQMGTRFLAAGALLMAWMRLARKASWPTRAQWRHGLCERDALRRLRLDAGVARLRRACRRGFELAVSRKSGARVGLPRGLRFAAGIQRLHGAACARFGRPRVELHFRQPRHRNA